jgi:hypothetical protein
MQSVGLLWTRERPVAEISTWWHKTRGRHPLPHPDSNPQFQQESGCSARLQTARPPRLAAVKLKMWTKEEKKQERKWKNVWRRGRRNTATEESRKVGKINDEEKELKKERRDMGRLKKEQANNWRYNWQRKNIKVEWQKKEERRLLEDRRRTGDKKTDQWIRERVIQSKWDEK